MIRRLLFAVRTRRAAEGVHLLTPAAAEALEELLRIARFRARREGRPFTVHLRAEPSGHLHAAVSLEGPGMPWARGASEEEALVGLVRLVRRRAKERATGNANEPLGAGDG